MTRGARIALALIRLYQLALSPFLGGSCRFVPSCSEYAREAIQGHGALCGLCLTARRLARCHPLAQPGLDPVPAPNKSR